MTARATTYIDAVNEMFGRGKSAIGLAASAVGITPIVRYYGRDTSVHPGADKFVVEVAQIGATDRQTAFGVTKKLYTSTGTLWFKLLVPQSGVNGYELGRRFADAIKKDFRKSFPGATVWYRNARVSELVPERGSYRFNVAVDYTYDELQ